MLRSYSVPSSKRSVGRTRLCLSILLLVAGWPAQYAVGQPVACGNPVTLVNFGATGGDSLIAVEAERLQKAPDWKPGGDEPPISTGKAVGAVNEWVRLNTPEILPVAVVSVNLKSVGCEPLGGRWFYLIQYASIAPGVKPTGKMAAVLMDGSVVAGQVAPTVSRPYVHFPNSLLMDLSRPGNEVQYDGPIGESVLGVAFATMLHVKQFDQLESELSKLLDSRQRMPDGRIAYAIVMRGVITVVQYGDPAENILEQIEAWRAHSPKSRHAPIVEAMYWDGYASYARGTGWANTVSAKAWELFRERKERARRTLRDAKQYAGENPLWQTEMITLAWDLDRSQKSVFALFRDAVRRDPWFLNHYFAVANRLTPRWGGDIDQYRQFVEDAVKRTQATDGVTMHARLYWIYAGIEHDRPFGDLGIPWARMKAGFDDLIVRYPSPWNLNNYASFACRANDKEAFLRLLPKLTPKEIRQDAWPSGFSFENCKETFTART